MQMVIQGRWDDDSPLLSLPHIESHHLYLFENLSKSTDKPCLIPIGLKSAIFNKYETLAKSLRAEFDDTQIEQIYKVSTFYSFIVSFKNNLILYSGCN